MLVSRSLKALRICLPGCFCSLLCAFRLGAEEACARDGSCGTKDCAYFESVRNQPLLAACLPAADAEGRRPSQPSFRRGLCRKLHQWAAQDGLVRRPAALRSRSRHVIPQMASLLRAAAFRTARSMAICWTHFPCASSSPALNPVMIIFLPRSASLAPPPMVIPRKCLRKSDRAPPETIFNTWS